MKTIPRELEVAYETPAWMTPFILPLSAEFQNMPLHHDPRSCL